MQLAKTCPTVLILLGALGAACLPEAHAAAPSTSVPAAVVVPTNANPASRTLTLEECIRRALEQNLAIQIGRLTPVRFQYSLAGSYGYYDPTFNFEARQQQVTAVGGFDPLIGEVPPTDTTTKIMAGSLGGYLPSGLRYEILGDFDRQIGERFATVSGLQVTRPFDDYNTGTRISLRQPLLRDFWTDPGRTAIQVAKKDLKISELAFEDQVRTLIRDVIITYYELIYAREEVVVQEKALELAQALVDQNREKVRVGKMAPLDQKQAEAQRAGSLANVLAARRQVSFRENLLKNLITDRYESWYGTGIQPADKLMAMAQTYDLVDSWTQALTKRPDFRQIRTELEKQGLQVKLSFNQLFPTLNLVGGYGLTGASDSTYTPVVSPLGQISWNQTYKSGLGDAWQQVVDVNNPRHSFGAVFSLPLSRQAERNRYKESKTTLKQVELQVRQAHQNILVEVDNAISQAKINFERVSATREARVYAEAALEAEQKKLDAGTTTMFEVLRLQRDLTATRSEEVRALADFNESMAGLYFAEGTLLERYKISLDFK